MNPKITSTPPRSHSFRTTVTLTLMKIPDNDGLDPEALLMEVQMYDTDRKSAVLEVPWVIKRLRSLLRDLLDELWSPIQLHPVTGRVIGRISPGSPQSGALGCGPIQDEVHMTLALTQPTLVASCEASITKMRQCRSWEARGRIFRNIEVAMQVGPLQCIQDLAVPCNTWQYLAVASCCNVSALHTPTHAASSAGPGPRLLQEANR